MGGLSAINPLHAGVVVESSVRSRSAMKLVPSDSLWVAPTTGLEYLPHDVATKKLAALAEAARGGVPA
jgi:methionine synthase II (cobalamin-independent)